MIPLPLKMVGQNIRKTTDHSEDHLCSKNVIEHSTDENISEARNFVKIKQKEAQKRKIEKDSLLELPTAEKLQIVNLASEKGASNSLKVLPLKNNGFKLNKSEYRERLHRRHGIEPRKLLKTSYVATTSQLLKHCIIQKVDKNNYAKTKSATLWQS